MVWALAIVGIAQEVWLARGARIASLVIYLLMGWLALLAVSPLRHALGAGSGLLRPRSFVPSPLYPAAWSSTSTTRSGATGMASGTVRAGRQPVPFHDRMAVCRLKSLPLP